MNEAEVKKKVEAYFTNTFPQFSVSQECDVSFGSKRGGFADVVLHTDKPGSFVAIAECKGPLPTPDRHEKAKEQLKSYMSATNTQYGVLAVGTADPLHWEFCENKYHNRFVSINRETFERSVENWEPISVEVLEDNLQRERKDACRWKRIALFLGVLFIVSISSLLLLWPEPPEPIVYITETGKKYHTYNCDFLKQYAEGKFAIYLDEAEKNYAPCRICSPHRTEQSK